MANLQLTVEGVTLAASWTDENPETRAAVADALPLEGDAARWGDELYFSVPVDVPAETAREAVPTGAVAYWPRGNAFCLFWGPTPASTDDRPRAASPVNVVANIDDTAPLAELDGGGHVHVARE